MSEIKVLFFGDIFGSRGIETVQKLLPQLKSQHQIDFVVAQGENVSGRKGLNYKDYQTLKSIGIDAITMGNHVWANSEIYNFIDNNDIIRPLNIESDYPGHGYSLFNIKGKKLLVASIMGVTFNPLMKPWKKDAPEPFFDYADKLVSIEADFKFIDFHAETTSEKSVFALYLDGKVDAICGTHTHVQTNDARKLPQGTLFISDVGMCGPQDCAIGANFEEVYQKMRFDSRVRFEVSPNPTQLNAVILTLNSNKEKAKIEVITIYNVLDKQE